MSNICNYCNKFMINIKDENNEDIYCEQCREILDKYKGVIEPFGNGRRISFDSFIHAVGLDICPKCSSDSKYYAKKNISGVMVYKCTNSDCNETKYIYLDIKGIEKAVNNNEPRKRMRKTQERTVGN